MVKGKEPAGLTSALVEGIRFSLLKRCQKIPCGEISLGIGHWKGCGMLILGDFQNSSDRSLSNPALISKIGLSYVGGWPGQAHRSQTVSYTFTGNISWSKPHGKTPFDS